MALDWINYHHLLYFWTVAKHGGVTRASEELSLSQPTISGQIRLLEDSLGAKLFTRSGRNLVMTDFGRLVFEYADEMFAIGRELSTVVRGRPTGRPAKLTIGVADVLPKLVVHRILEPVLRMPERVRIVCQEDRTDRLLAELSLQALDLILADAPIGPHVHVRAYNHLLGTSEVTIYASRELAAKYRRNFPASLTGAPFLLPIEHSAMRRGLDQWFASQAITPEITGEFQDSALMKVFAQSGAGLFAAPAVIESELKQLYGTVPVGRLPPTVGESFYAISIERRVKHPAVLAIIERAQHELFSRGR